jgi:tetratricopeptide (TPR) repeat protein
MPVLLRAKRALRTATIALAVSLVTPVGAARPETTPARIPLAVITTRLDSLWTARDWQAYHAVIDSVLPLATAADDTTLRLELLIRRGMQQVHFGGGRRSEPVLAEAVALAEAAADSARLCAAVRWLAVAVGLQGYGERARALYRRLQDLAVATGDRRHEGWALVGLAWSAIGEGRADEGADLYRRAGELFAATGDVEGEIWALNGLGMARSRLQEYDRAIASYRRVAELARAARFRMAEAQALNNLGHHEYLMGDPGRAVANFAAALRTQLEIGQRREAVIPLVNLALCEAELGRHEEAAGRLREALAICEEDNFQDLRGIVLNEQGNLAERRGRRHEAAACYRRALGLGEALDQEVRARCLTGLAGALAAMDSSAAALEVMERGARELGDLRLGGFRLVFDTNLGERLLAAGRPGPALALLVGVADAAERDGFHGRAVRALDLAARCRLALGEPLEARALLERGVAAWEADRGLPADPEWREQRGEAGRSLFTDLAGLLLSPAGGLSGDERAEAVFDRLQVYKARTLQERMSGPGRAERGTGRAPVGITRLSDLQRTVLRPGELFLDAYLGPRTSVLLAVTRDTCRAVVLPPAGDLDGRLRRYHELISDPSGREASAAALRALRATGGDLARILFGEMSDLVTASGRVLFSPDGALNLLPLCEMELGKDPEAGREASGAGRDWIRVPSASILARLRAAAAGRTDEAPVRVLAVADEQTGDGPALPAARREVQALARRYRRVTALLADRGDGVSAQDLAAHDVLHFATHVHVDDQYPWQSAILLDPAQEGGGLRAAGIARLDLHADLAVLASCASATGRILSGEGVLGLSSAFLSAGVPTVVATLWPVDDAVTARLMTRLYEGLARGGAVATALRRAQLEVRADPATSHPFYWAGFIVVGEGSRTVPLQPRPHPDQRILVAVLVMLFVAGAIFVLLRRRSS